MIIRNGFNFALCLRLARDKRGISQAGLAKETGLAPSAISHFETGRREPNLSNLRLLARVLRVSADTLLGIGR